jgi:hypothetical protein
MKNNFAEPTQKTQPLYCWEGVFTAPLHKNGSYFIVACIFIAAGMCLPSRCLAMNVNSDVRASCHNIKMDIREVSCITEDFIFLAQDLIQLPDFISVYFILFLENECEFIRPIVDRNLLVT